MWDRAFQIHLFTNRGKDLIWRFVHKSIEKTQKYEKYSHRTA
jgi:hypothetical protein